MTSHILSRVDRLANNCTGNWIKHPARKIGDFIPVIVCSGGLRNTEALTFLAILSVAK